MKLSLLGGMAKGHPLKLPPESVTRPTQSLLKRRLFDSYQDFEGDHFYDLCAGSGSMGLEAWSRGASKVVLVDNSPKVVPILKDNIHSLKKSFPQDVAERSLLLESQSALKFLDSGWVPQSENINHLYFDPPYQEHQLYLDFLALVKPWLKNEKIYIWIESDRLKGLPFETLEAHCSVSKTFKQGSHFIALLD